MMSTVFLHIGQCGNQLGQQFWQTVLRDEEAKRTLCRRDNKLPSIHVDTEKKVITSLVRNGKILPVRDTNVVLSKQGRGMNWAMGYHGTARNPSTALVEQTLETMRREIERCDCFCGSIIMHSLSGGTGSGFGSRLCEGIRDAYPMAYLLDISVAPHSHGESPLQHYNNLMCLSWMQKFADGIILFHNDEVLHQLQGMNVTKATRDAANVNIQMMNGYISDSLAGLLCPISSNMTTSGISCGTEAWELLRSVAPMPVYKFLHVNHVTKSKSTWESMASNLIQNTVRYNADGKPLSALSSLVAVRGDTSNSFTSSLQVVEKKLRGAFNYVKWNPFPIDFWIGNRQGILSKDSSSITTCMNTTHITDFMQRVTDRARAMYEARAFLHWYHRYSCEEPDFEEAFSTLAEVVQDYREAGVG
ncbi:uncharacterized protein [Diadema setosum]|uniref:uncharacterized protein n=1 Tax=Diadema setosum TaxID=31175 RepID=UPI003B3AB0A7